MKKRRRSKRSRRRWRSRR